MSTEWSVSFHWRTTSFQTSITSIVHFTIDSDYGQYGDRAPAVYVVRHNEDNQFHIVNAVNGDINLNFNTLPLQPNHKYHVEIQQRYISQGDYHYFVKIDGVEIYSKVNRDARQFYNVKVYASDPWNEADGYISNFKLTNFL